MVEVWIQDVRYALRLLRRSPMFAITAALSLAIGIGANAAIFSLVSALLLRPLPGLADASRLVDIGRTQGGRGFDTTSYPNYRDIRERTRTLDGVFAYRVEPMPMSLASADGAERVYGTMVTGNYFQVLGTRAQHGRLFTDADDVAGRNAVTVISDDLWHRRFAGDPSIVGRTVTITGQPYAVIGIAPRGFQGTTLLRSDLWLPLSNHPRGREADMFTSRQVVWLMMGGRLKPGVSVQQANAELRTMGDAMSREYPTDNEARSFAVAASSIFPGRTGVIGGFLAVLMAAVGLILLIACVNLAGMLLARSTARRGEIAVRLAMGAARPRLVRQLLTETAVLLVAGCALGLVLNEWLTALLLSLLPELPVPVGVDVALDWRVVTFAVILSGAAAIVAGLAPALQAARTDLVSTLKADTSDRGSGRMRLRNLFLVAQLTLSLLLAVTAGLFLRSLSHAANTQPGFAQDGIDVVTLDVSLAGYKEAEGLSFARELVTRAGGMSGVQSAVLSTDLPLDGERMGFGDVRLPGAPRTAGRRTTAPVDWNLVTPGFFRTLDVQLLRGRDFSDADTATAPHVAIVNQALARHLFGDADPLGRQVEVDTPFGRTQDKLTIVGVAANAQFVSLGDAAEPYIYAPLAQRYHPRVSLLVRRQSRTLIPDVRALVRQLNPNLPITSAMPLREVTAIGLVPQRLGAAVAGTLGVVGLLLAAIGIYGVAAYGVGRRARELGIRMALGADRRSVVALVLRQSVRLTLAGVGVGIVCSAAAAQLLRSLLYGISPVDPMTFAGAALLFVAVAAAASYLPARRASRLDPMVVLRE